MLINNIFGAWVLSIVFISVLFNHTLRYTPDWTHNSVGLRDRWDDINLTAMFAGIGASAVTAWGFSGGGFEYMTYAAITAGMTTFALVQTFESDYATREADRHLLRYVMFPVIVLGFGFHWISGDPNLAENMVFLLLAGCATFFLPGFGKSDARAVIILLASMMALFNFVGVQYAMIGFLGLVLVYLLITAIHQRSAKAFWGRTSLPAVPLILAPPVVLMLSAPVFF